MKRKLIPIATCAMFLYAAAAGETAQGFVASQDLVDLVEELAKAQAERKSTSDFVQYERHMPETPIFTARKDALRGVLRKAGCGSFQALKGIAAENAGPRTDDMTFYRREAILQAIDVLGASGLNCPGVREWLARIATESENKTLRYEAMTLGFPYTAEEGRRLAMLLIEGATDTAEVRILKGLERSLFAAPAYDISAKMLVGIFALIPEEDFSTPRERKKLQRFWRKYWSKNKNKLVWNVDRQGFDMPLTDD